MKVIIQKFVTPAIRLQYLTTSRPYYSTSMTYQENKIKVDKYNINYLKVGHGAHSVLCMPGALGSIWTDFKPQVEGFDSEKFTLVVWDAPGYGKSRPPEREFHEDYFGQDVDVAVEFMKALDIPKFSLMGWSYGGVTSMILATKYLEVVQKMVIWGVSSFFLPHEIEMYKKIKNVATWTENMRKPMIELYGEERFSELWAGVVDAMIAVHNNKDEKFTKRWQTLKNVICPTLILYGEKDPLVDKSHVYELHRSIQGSRIHIYPGGKHDIHIQYAEDFNKRIQEFLLKE